MNQTLRKQQLQLINLATQKVIAQNVVIADTYIRRGIGLLGKKSFAAGQALWIVPCSSVHMFFMRFAIDLIYLNKAMEVTKIVHQLKPWRVSFGTFRSHSVVELPVGTLQHFEISINDTLCIQPVSDVS